MRKALLMYAICGAGLVTLYGVGGYSGWWRGFVRWNPAVDSAYDSGNGSRGGGSQGGAGYGGGWSGGSGGFRGGK